MSVATQIQTATSFVPPGMPRLPRLLHAVALMFGLAAGPAASAASTDQRSAAQPTAASGQRELAPGGEVLVVGATGSVGRHVVAEAMQAGYRVRALVRDRARAEGVLPPGVTLVVGDLVEPQSLVAAVQGVDGIVFTHGANSGADGAREVNYGGVRNVLRALEGRRVRVAMMTAIGVTRPIDAARVETETRGWKRRGERLLRASGLPYTIVRPGWFDYNAPNQHRLVLLQGDLRNAGTPEDGVVARRQIAEVLVASLSSPAADRKTFELVAEKGAAQADLEPLFAAIPADGPGALDAARDRANLPLGGEPRRFVEDLEAASRRR